MSDDSHPPLPDNALLTDADLWAHLRGRVNQRPHVPMQAIADELGVPVADLCDWMLAYTPTPKRPLPTRRLLTTAVPTGQRQAHAFLEWRAARAKRAAP